MLLTKYKRIFTDRKFILEYDFFVSSYILIILLLVFISIFSLPTFVSYKKDSKTNLYLTDEMIKEKALVKNINLKNKKELIDNIVKTTKQIQELNYKESTLLEQLIEATYE